MLPTCMDCGGILASEQLRQALHSLGVKTDFGLACSGTEVKTENFECILKILEHNFSLPIFFPQRKTYELRVFFENYLHVQVRVISHFKLYLFSGKTFGAESACYSIIKIHFK